MTLKSFANLKKAEGFGETLKFGVGLAIGIAADMALTCILKTHIPAGKGVTKLMMRLGVFMLAMKAGDDVENYFYDVVDGTKNVYQEMKQEAMKAAKEIADRNVMVKP